MDQNEKQSNEEQEQKPGSSYDVHVKGAQAPTVVGDHSTIVQDHRRITQVNVVVQQATIIQPEKINGGYFVVRTTAHMAII
jgi:hypothetical protein